MEEYLLGSSVGVYSNGIVRVDFLQLKMVVIDTLMNTYEKFCVDEAQYHIRRAQELLTEGLRDPKKYYDEGRDFYRMMAKLFPFMVLLQQSDESQRPDQDESGNLSDSQSSIQSSEGSFVVGTPPRHSDF